MTRQQGLPSGPEAQTALERALGYLNFSSGVSDPAFLSAINLLFAQIERPSQHFGWQIVCHWLELALEELAAHSEAFADVHQAKQALTAIRSFFPAYREYHRDLLAHQDDDELFNSFMWGRVAEVVLTAGTSESDSAVLIPRAIRQLNDYIGYRPVAVLESQKIEPYEHEWLRPIPLYIRGAGEAVGRFQEVVHECLELLRHTDDQLLAEAYFDLDHLDELAVDPRAYDFEHPANKRPNHHFGQWDAHHIDNKGFYRRFVVQGVTLNALLRRVEEAQEFDHDELLLEAAAVLAGTVLMSSGICGYGPDTHDSDVSLSKLLMRIAQYRDVFYEQLIQQIPGRHGVRLREESDRLQQPFAAARHDLNRRLTECRAWQLQRVQLAKLYARMGYADAASEQTARVQVPSARLSCEIDCLLTKARTSIAVGDLSPALQSIEDARACLTRGIHCGAIVDPWNILGFDGNFSLFGPIENSMRDYRIEELVETIEELMELFAQLWSAAAALEQKSVCEQTSVCFDEFATWWHQYAAHEMNVVEAEDPHAVFAASRKVSEALLAWHEQGEATGDIGFWAPHVQLFDSCRAYWLVINTLLQRDDKVAALGLLMHWIGQTERIPLEQGETSFYELSLQWLVLALRETGELRPQERTGWRRIRRFFDYLEANAGEYWQVPEFSPEGETTVAASPREDETFEETDEEEETLFDAAYENVVYRDSTDDGIEGNIFDFDTQNEDYLQQVSRPIVDRLAFLEHVAQCWKLIAVAWSAAESTAQPDAQDEETSALVRDLLGNAADHLERTVSGINELLDAVSGYRLALPTGDPESVMQYDRLRLLKDSLIDQIINTQVCVVEGQQFLLATGMAQAAPEASTLEDQQAVQLLDAALHGHAELIASMWRQVLDSFEHQPILYVPLARGGAPKTIVRVKARQRLAQNLLEWLPRLGMMRETYQLIELVRRMERRVPVGSGSITEFDDLFEVGCRSIVAALLDAYDDSDETDEAWLVSYLEEMMEPLLRSWLAHSRTLRLSVLEQVLDDGPWGELVSFIRRFGRDLFTQRFLNLGNVRGILHQGVQTWLERLQEFPADEAFQPLLDALETDLEMSEAVDKLTLVLESVVENYSEYRDYNSTTTQSDRGDLLFSLLDFLRLRTSYDRVVWNLRPIVVAHQVLVTRGYQEVATQWRHSLRQRIEAEADRHMSRLKDMEKTYAMRLPSISERLGERFMRPLLVDQLCALIRPAMNEQADATRQVAFRQIHEQANEFMNEPTGAGLDVPLWLMQMEDEVRKHRHDRFDSPATILQEFLPPSTKLSIEELQSQVSEWRKGN